MSKLISFVRSGYYSIMPYKKNMLLMVGLVFFLSFFSETSASISGMAGAYAGILATYPFAIGDKNNSDTLYSILPIKRIDVILGRYLYAFSLQIGYVAIMCISTALSSIVNGTTVTVEGMLSSISAYFIVSSFLIALQMPAFFKYGYTKGKSASFIPLALILAAVFGGSFFLKGRDAGAIINFLNAFSPLTFTIMAIIICIILIIISATVSYMFYNKRDL